MNRIFTTAQQFITKLLKLKSKSSKSNDTWVKEFESEAVNAGMENIPIQNIEKKLLGHKKKGHSIKMAKIKARFDAFNFEAASLGKELSVSVNDRIKNLSISLISILNNTVLGIHKKYEALEEKRERKIKERAKCREDLTKFEKKVGFRPKKKTLLDKPKAFIGVLALTTICEAPFTYHALQEYGAGITLTIGFFTLVFSFLIGLCSDFMGRFFADDNRPMAIVSALAALVVTLTVIYIRTNTLTIENSQNVEEMVMVDSNIQSDIIINSSINTQETAAFKHLEPALNAINLVLLCIALILGYLTHRCRPYWATEEKTQSLSGEIEDIAAQIEQKPLELANAETEFNALVLRKAQEESQAVSIKYNTLQTKIAELQTEAAKEEKMYEAEIQKGLAIIRAAYERGASYRK